MPTHPKTAAIASLLLALPFITIFTLLMVERRFFPYLPLLSGMDSRIGSLIVIGTFVLLLPAFIINARLIGSSLRAGRSLAAHPLNLLLAVMFLSIILWVVGSIIVDQYPCWIGVPNCD